MRSLLSECGDESTNRRVFLRLATLAHGVRAEFIRADRNSTRRPIPVFASLGRLHEVPKKASAGHRTSGDPAELVAEQVSRSSGGAATASLGLASGRAGALRLATGANCTHGTLGLRLAGGLCLLLHNPCHSFLSFSFPVWSLPKTHESQRLATRQNVRQILNRY